MLSIAMYMARFINMYAHTLMYIAETIHNNVSKCKANDSQSFSTRQKIYPTYFLICINSCTMI